MRALRPRTLAVLLSALVLGGCGVWSGQDPRGGSGTCSARTWTISGYGWADGIYRPMITDSVNRTPAPYWLYAADAWNDSWNTCGVPNDDRYMVVASTDRNRDVANGFPSNDGVSRAEYVYTPGWCAGCGGGAVYTSTTWGAFLDVDVAIFHEGPYWPYTDQVSRGIALHEFGHAAGLCHNGGCFATSGYIDDGNVMGGNNREQLGIGDLSGLHYIYGGHTH